MQTGTRPPWGVGGRGAGKVGIMPAAVKTDPDSSGEGAVKRTRMSRVAARSRAPFREPAGDGQTAKSCDLVDGVPWQHQVAYRADGLA